MEIYQYYTGALGVNTYYVRDEINNKSFIVDPGDYSEKLMDKILDHGSTVEYIILTHGHGDHIGGIKSFQNKIPNLKVVAHTEEREMLANPSLNLSGDCCGHDISIYPDIFVNDGDTLPVGDMELKFIHTPGHSFGGMCIYVGNALFSGDTLFKLSVGRTDFWGGSFAELKNSIKNKLFLLPDDTQVFPGHMGSTTIGIEKRSNPFV